MSEPEEPVTAAELAGAVATVEADLTPRRRRRRGGRGRGQGTETTDESPVADTA